MDANAGGGAAASRPASALTESAPAEEVLDLLHRQLDRYREITTRLANNGVQVKTWCVTATGAVAALAIDNDRPELLLVGVAVVGIFLFLDSYYLTLERHFRKTANDLVDAVANSQVADWTALLKIAEPYSATTLRAVAYTFFHARSLWPFYTALATALLIGGVLLLIT